MNDHFKLRNTTLFEHYFIYTYSVFHGFLNGLLHIHTGMTFTA